MRSRSTRLFVILLHLVGVSRNLPHKGIIWNVGIVGVYPQTIFVERLDLSMLVKGGADVSIGAASGVGVVTEQDLDNLLDSPYWFQDDGDGKCLGPTGQFAECGDTTLWRLIRRNRRNVINMNGSSYDSNSTTWVYALQSVGDVDSRTKDSSATQHIHDDDDLRGFRDDLRGFSDLKWRWNLKWKNRKKASRRGEECLAAGVEVREKMDRMNNMNSVVENSVPLVLIPCDEEAAFRWQVDETGVLSYISAGQTGQQRVSASKSMEDLILSISWNLLVHAVAGLFHPVSTSMGESLCIWRESLGSAAILAACNSGDNDLVLDDIEMDGREERKRIANFSLVRYESGARSEGSASTAYSMVRTVLDNPIGLARTSPRSGDNVGSKIAPDIIEPIHASDRKGKVRGARKENVVLDHKDEEDSSSQYAMSSKTRVSGAVNLSKQGRHRQKMASLKKRLPTEEWRNPGIPLSSKETSMLLQRSTPMQVASDVGLAFSKKHRRKVGSQQKIHIDATESPQMGTKHWKIPVHPYIEASRKEKWVDPQTGLQFPTDICEYLGHTRKQSGRHTLVGVGQYTRTVLKIKVYGVALYISKRDALASPIFATFASLDADQLRKRKDFYEYLMSIPPSSGRGVDRTLFLKLNMQLGTDMMRTSLQADWKMLTEAHKEMLISSSFKPRPAGERMLSLIASEENSSNCSCGQFAPEKYHADPTCCARGTELAFTWRKNGSLEVRVDGTLVDTFPEPDLAKGIFFEYLRYDDPISVDALERFADGFPFLLAPLAQVPRLSVASTNVEPPDAVQEKNSLKVVEDVVEFVSSRVGEVASVLQSGVRVTIGGAVAASRKVGVVLRDGRETLDKQRENISDRITTLSMHSFHIMSVRFPFIPCSLRDCGLTVGEVRSKVEDVMEWDGGSRGKDLRGEGIDFDVMFDVGSEHIDEISVIIHPNMSFSHKLCLATVHLYLMLLLIVSLPGSESTKLIIRRARSGSIIQRKTRYQAPIKPLIDKHCPKISEKERADTQKLSTASSKGIVAKEDEEVKLRAKRIPDIRSKLKKSLSYYV